MLDSVIAKKQKKTLLRNKFIGLYHHKNITLDNNGFTLFYSSHMMEVDSHLTVASCLLIFIAVFHADNIKLLCFAYIAG